MGKKLGENLRICTYILFSVTLLGLVLSKLMYIDAAPEVVEKPGDSSLARLKATYIQAKDLSEREVTSVRYL